MNKHPIQPATPNNVRGIAARISSCNSKIKFITAQYSTIAEIERQRAEYAFALQSASVKHLRAALRDASLPSVVAILAGELQRREAKP